MPANLHFGRSMRLRRLYRHGDDRLLVVPMDHSVSDGPIGAPGDLLARMAGSGVDAVVLHKGALRTVDPEQLTGTSLIVHLSASTHHAPDPNAKYLVASVEEAVRLGADAVSVHVNLGSLDEGRQIADMARMAESCDRWNMPLLAMMYPRGPRIADPRDPALIAHAGVLAADLGADVVKLPFTGSADTMRDVVASCPVPVIVAGGARLDDNDALLAYVDEVLASPVAGLAMGRNIFQSPDPGRLARAVAERVHAQPATTAPRELQTAAR
jgi:2-amino-4,5-dihydroxy-6-oxo-7-(phosphonooxy)heptanoate synthase